MNIHISMEAIRYAEIRRRILELHPDIDDQTLADTLEGATDLKEVLGVLVRSALDDEYLAKALKERTDAMKTRLARLEARATSKRLMAVETMQMANLKGVTEPDFTASVRLAPASVAITNEWELPPTYLVPQPARPDRRAILAALNTGIVVPGAALAEPKYSLTIRSA